jgi:hypothetical protein
MKPLSKLFGLALIVVGLYWLGQNIILTTRAAYGWQTLPAAGSVILLLGGLWTLFNVTTSDRNFGWIMLGGAIALIFMSGGVIIQPTSLWTFLVGFSALFGGYKLLRG